MRLMRVLLDGTPRWAVMADGPLRLLPVDWRVADMDESATAQLAERHVPTATPLLPPLELGARVFCVGRNYPSHAGEMQAETPSHPSIFTRDADSLVGHGQVLERPAVSAEFDFEGEIGVVIGSGGHHLRGTAATRAIGGYTLVMDGSVRVYQRHSLFAGKNFRRSGSIGPWIVTADTIEAPDALTLETRVNGEVMQRGCLAELTFSVGALIEYISSILPLRAGDIIATGTPAGVGAARNPPRWLVPGDRISLSAEGIGVLENVVTDPA